MHVDVDYEDILYDIHWCKSNTRRYWSMPDDKIVHVCTLKTYVFTSYVKCFNDINAQEGLNFAYFYFPA